MMSRPRAQWGLAAVLSLAGLANAATMNVDASASGRFGPTLSSDADSDAASGEGSSLFGKDLRAGAYAKAGLTDIPWGVLMTGPKEAGLWSTSAARLDAGSIGVRVSADAVGLVAVVDGPAANLLAASSASVSFQDAIRLTSDDGSPVSVRLKSETRFSAEAATESSLLLPSGIVNIPASVNWENSFFSRIEWTWGPGPGGSTVHTVCTWSPWCPSPQAKPGLDIFERDIVVPSGTTIYLSKTISATAEAGLYNAWMNTIAGGWASTKVDAWNSLRSGVEMTSQGAHLSSASGHDYVFVPHALAVPEPGSMAMMAAGVLALLTLRRRRA